MFEYELIERARADRRHVVLPEGDEERILRAAESLTRRGVCDLTLLGDVDAIEQRARELGLDLGSVRIVDPVTRRPVAARVRRRVRQTARPQGNDAGAGARPDERRQLLRHHDGAHRTRRRHGFRQRPPHRRHHPARFRNHQNHARSQGGQQHLLHVPARPRPGLRRLRHQPRPEPGAARRHRHLVGRNRRPLRRRTPHRHALLLDRRQRPRRRRRQGRHWPPKSCSERRPDLPVEGPIQYDAAVDLTVAATKLPDSAVAGRATVLIFPDLNTGNNTYKAVQRSAGAVAIGPVMQGLRKPVNDLSRGATVRDIISTVAITAIQSQL